MLATSGVPPSLDGWVAEPKLDGWRARILVDHDGLSVRTRSRAGHHRQRPRPRAAPLLRDPSRPRRRARRRRRPADRLLPRRPHARPPRPVPGHAVAFAAFDLLWHDGELITRRPYHERRALLDDLRLAELGVPTIPVFDFDDAPALFRACAAHGVEGLVLKQLSAPYLPGKRTTSLAQGQMRRSGRSTGSGDGRRVVSPLGPAVPPTTSHLGLCPRQDMFTAPSCQETVRPRPLLSRRSKSSLGYHPRGTARCSNASRASFRYCTPNEAGETNGKPPTASTSTRPTPANSDGSSAPQL